MSELETVTIYTDGACDPNPGSGGWAALLRYGKHEKILTGSASETTNNRMELTAAVEAFRALKRPFIGLSQFVIIGCMRMCV